MIKRLHRVRRTMGLRPGLIWVLVSMVLVTAVLAGCGGDEAESYTPPPATIIRASDMPAPTATPVPASEPTALPMPPTIPAPPAAANATSYPYPIVFPTPRFTMTPVVYPTP